MPTNPTDRQQRFINMAAAHADDFKTRVAQHDQESSFPHENVDAMKAAGYTALLVPEEFGGGGASPLELAIAYVEYYLPVPIHITRTQKRATREKSTLFTGRIRCCGPCWVRSMGAC